MSKLHNGLSSQRKASVKRLLDAKKLLAAGKEHARGAMYLAGYSVECKIKAIAMERYNCVSLDELRRARKLDENDVYTHGLEALFGKLLPNNVYDRFKKCGVHTGFVRYVDAVDEVNRWLSSNV